MKKRETRSYDKEFKAHGVRLAKELGTKKVTEELGISIGTLTGWVHAVKKGESDVGKGERTPQEAMTLAVELQQLRADNKKQAKEIARLEELNEFLEEASAFLR